MQGMKNMCGTSTRGLSQYFWHGNSLPAAQGKQEVPGGGQLGAPRSTWHPCFASIPDSKNSLQILMLWYQNHCQSFFPVSHLKIGILPALTRCASSSFETPAAHLTQVNSASVQDPGAPAAPDMGNQQSDCNNYSVNLHTNTPDTASL